MELVWHCSLFIFYLLQSDQAFEPSSTASQAEGISKGDRK